MAVSTRRKRFWESLETRFQPSPGLPSLDPQVAVRVGIYGTIGAAVNIAALGTIQFVYDEPAAATLAVSFALTYSAVATFFYFSGSFEIATKIILYVSVVGNVAVHIILGGYLWSGGYLFFGVLVSATSAMLLRRRSTVLITGTYLVAAVVLGIFEPTIRSWREQPDPVVSVSTAVDVFIASLLILVPISYLLTKRLAAEQQRSEALLLNVFPASIAKRLKTRPDVIADEFEECSVLFADLVGFTAHSGRVSPEQLVDQLNLVFSEFDDLVDQTGTEKIKTVGDGYLAVAGAPISRPDHVDATCELALAMQDEMTSINLRLGTDFKLRVGVHTGRVVAGVIGNSRFSYDIWGDTVNVASRLQTEAAPGAIVVSEAVAEAASSRFRCHPLGQLDLKGKGPVKAYQLDGQLS